MVVRVYPADKGGCGIYRMFQPYGAINNPDIQIIVDGILRPKEAAEADIIVLQRQVNPESFATMLHAKSKGTKVIYEIDDDLFTIEPTNVQAYKYYMTDNVHHNMQLYLKYADVVTVSTPYLGAEMGKRTTSPIFVIPNRIDPRIWDRHYAAKKQNDGKIIIGWAGGSSHLGDFNNVVDAIVAILKKYDNVYFRFVGQSFKKAKEFKDVQDKILESPYAEYAEYGQNLCDVDIGIIPLAYNKFNQSKSNVKYLEYSAMGIPSIATDIRTYNNDIAEGINGFLVEGNKESEWYTKIIKLVENENLRTQVGQAARDYVYARYNQLTHRDHEDLLLKIGGKKC